MSSVTGSNAFYQGASITNANAGQASFDALAAQVAADGDAIEANVARLDAVEEDVAVHEARLDGQDAVISGLFTRVGTAEGEIDVLQTEMDAVESTNAAQDASLASILQRISEVSYNSSLDTTFIMNRLSIRNVLDSDNSSAPQLTLFNTSAQPNNAVQFMAMVGAENGSWSSLTLEGDALFLTRKTNTGVPNAYVGGMVFCNHGSAGFRFSYDPARASEFRSDVNMLAHNLSLGSITLAGADLATTLGGLDDRLLVTEDLSLENRGRIITAEGELVSLDVRVDALEAVDHGTMSTDLLAAGHAILGAGNVETEALHVVSTDGDTTLTATADAGTANFAATDVGAVITTIALQTQTAAGVLTAPVTVTSEDLDFGGRNITGFQYPLTRSFSVRLTYDGSKFLLYRADGFADYLVDFVAESPPAPIRTIGSGNVEIYVDQLFFGGSSDSAVYDLHTSGSGLYRVDGDANSTILVGAPQKTWVPGVGCKLEFWFSRCDGPGSASNLIVGEGYITIQFSVPWV